MNYQPNLFESDAEELTRLSEGSHAKTLAARERALASGANEVDSGTSSTDSSENSARLGLSVRMCLLSALGALTSCWLTWKDQGTPAGRSWWVLTTLGHRTGESGCGSSRGWLTPKTPTGGGQAVRTTPGGGLRKLEDQLAGLLDQESRNTSGKSRDWSTPMVVTGKHPGRVLRKPNQQTCLSIEAHAEWSTPRSNREGAPDSHGKAPIRGVLNSAWVESLMNFPHGWTDLL